MTQRQLITRAVPLLDLEIDRRDGRTVTAYAATFDDPYEVIDSYGHYLEEIDRSAFNMELGRGIERIVPLFNHGLTIWGKPSERDSDPLGVPLEIKPDGRGLLTRTRFGTTPRADEVLTMLKDGTVKAFSFRGPVLRSDRARRHTSGLNLIRRTVLGLKDYGPGTLAVNLNASLVAIRSTTMLADQIAQLSDEERAELLAQFSPPPADDDGTGHGDNDPPPADDDPPALDTSQLEIDIEAAMQAQRRRRTKEPQ